VIDRGSDNIHSGLQIKSAGEEVCGWVGFPDDHIHSPMC